MQAVSPEPISGSCRSSFGDSSIRSEERLWMKIPCDWRRPDDPRTYSIFWNYKESCGRVFPRPNSSEIKKSHSLDGYYTRKKDNCNKGDRPLAKLGFVHYILMRMAWRLDFGVHMGRDWWKLQNVEDLLVLDVGCGDGRNADHLASLGAKVIGIEPETTSRQKCVEKGHTAIAGTAEDIECLVDQSAFDIVLLSHVLEHCADPDVVIQNCKSALRRGGKIIVEVPNNQCVGLRFFRESWYWLDVPRHINFFTRASLESVLVRNGFRITSAEHCGYSRQFSHHWVTKQKEIRQRMFGSRHKLSTLTYFIHFSFTLMCGKDRKYDSIRVAATID